jgi:tryptophan halogenase
LLAAIEGKPLAPPRLLRFKAGRRQRSWVGNVVAVGLSSGFLEPLESTSIYLAQMAITNLIERFPARDISPVDRDSFNAAVDWEYDRIRDFLILHYHATTRDDSMFWRHMRTMPIPQTLTDRLALWRRTACVSAYEGGLFQEPSWLAVLLGQGIVPVGWDPRADIPDLAALARAIGTLGSNIRSEAEALPDHATYLRREGAAWSTATSA